MVSMKNNENKLSHKLQSLRLFSTRELIFLTSLLGLTYVVKESF